MPHFKNLDNDVRKLNNEFFSFIIKIYIFSGLKVLKPQMVKTTNEYFKEKAFYFIWFR